MENYTICDAINERRIISFDYKSSKGNFTTMRFFAPHVLFIHANGNGLLIGIELAEDLKDSGEIKTFKTDEIENADLLIGFFGVTAGLMPKAKDVKEIICSVYP